MTRRKSTKHLPDWRGWPPFALPGHSWILTEWITPEFEQNVIRRCGNNALVRGGKGSKWFGEPTEPTAQIQTWDRRREDEEAEKFFEGDRDPMVNLFVRGKVSKDAIVSLSIKANVLLNMLVELAQQDGNAAHALFEIAEKAVGSLNQLAEDKPGHLQDFSELATIWPVMMSTHPHLCEDHKSLFTRIKLGVKAPIEIDKNSKWKPDKATGIAWCLLSYMLGIRCDDCRNPLAERAKLLPEFDDDTAIKWWLHAESILFLSYPRETLDRVPELVSIVTDPKKRTSPGRVRQAILDKLKGRFISLAKTPASYRS